MSDTPDLEEVEHERVMHKEDRATEAESELASAPCSVPIAPDVLENFERAFSSGTSGLRRGCQCGKEYFDNDENAGDWDEGELEGLLADPNAIGVPYSVGSVVIQNHEYVTACECWHPLALRVMGFIEDHAASIADFLKLEKQRKQKAADRSPTVD